MAVIASLILFGSPALAGATGLRAHAEAFAGAPVRVDPRLDIPACPNPIHIDWRGEDRRALLATCPATSWRLVLPVSGGPSVVGRSAPLIRRGEPVTVEAAGPGYAIRIDAVAQGDGWPGERLMVKNLRSGALVPVDVEEGGALLLSGSR